MAAASIELRGRDIRKARFRMPDNRSVDNGGVSKSTPHDWERSARKQAARADYLENLLRSALEVIGAIEERSHDDFEDRMTCEECSDRGWPSDGFVGDGHLAFCAQHA